MELNLISSCQVIEWELIYGIHLKSNEADSLCMLLVEIYFWEVKKKSLLARFI